jgi:hypothetical protein
VVVVWSVWSVFRRNLGEDTEVAIAVKDNAMEQAKAMSNDGQGSQTEQSGNGTQSTQTRLDQITTNPHPTPPEQH